jgi:asparagine synthase (glutamine-hydrolysing)
MCGIAGIVSLRRDAPPPPEARLRAGASALVHRGPDDEGFHREPGIGLAFRRLSILDLSGGHQPMSNEDGSVQVVYNGEIYNYRELSARLAAKGHRFKTRSDTEVLVHLYEENGADLVHELRGMFAFALWDSRRRVLLLVRDRLGIKPLFYCQRGDELLFASEIKGILAMLPQEDRAADEANLARFLSIGYFPGERTAFCGIRKLPPAHLLTCGDGGIATRRYWSLPQVVEDPGFTRDEAVRRLRELLEQSVRLRLISDVPLGAFLSGGVDSSCVVSLMRKVSPDPVKTFTIGVEDRDRSEVPVAKAVSQALGTHHHELVVTPDAIELVDQVVRSFDEPFGDPSAIPTFLVSRLARGEVTVALSGDGGDELFSGYTRYRSLRRLERVRWLPRNLRRVAADLLRRHGGGSFQAVRAGFFLARSLKTFPDDYLDSINSFEDPQVLGALNLEWIEAASRPWDSLPGPAGDPVEGAQRFDLENYLPEDILAKVDRMSMACSLEARVPLLDHRVVEFVAALPPAWKQTGPRPKALLLDAVGESLPPMVWNRAKRGFGIPLDRWFKTELREYLGDLLLGDRARRRGIWDPKGMESLLTAHWKGVWNLSEHLWSFLTLELWYRHYLDGLTASREVRSAESRVAGAVSGRTSEAPR